MQQPIFAFVFPFGEHGGEFRCKRNFADAESAANWAVEIILKEGDDFCYFKEVASADYVFEPACESHTEVRWSWDGCGWQMLEVINDFDEEMELYPKG